MLKGTATSIGRARRLRREMSLPERLLWRELRGRKLGFKFRKQHPAGPLFVLDFACLEARLAIEVDGEAHDRGTNPARDEGRDEWLADHDFRTLRIPAREVLANLEGVLAHIAEHCEQRTSPVRGGGPRAKRVVEGLARTQKGTRTKSPRSEQPLHQPPATAATQPNSAFRQSPGLPRGYVPPPRAGED